LSENVQLRSRLMTLCTDNPLALHRLWKLQRDYSTPKGICVAIDDHAKRVEWQLHRIYRARNNLVHAGKRPSFLDSLIVNMDEFFAASLGTIINAASRETGRSDIDDLIAQIGIEFRIYRQFVAAQKGPTLSPETLLRIVS
jgi:hypothetical protein